MKLQKPLFLLAALFAAQHAHAHASWIAERLDQPTIIYGHGGEDNAYGDKTISHLTGLDKDGKVIALDMEKHAHNVSLKAGDEHYAAAYVIDNGYWTKDADGKWHNQPKHAVANAASASHSIKTALGILREGSKIDPAALPDLKLLIVPLGDVAHSHMGDKIGVQVLFEGKPLAGAKIIGDYVNDSDNTVATTDADGKAEIAVRNHGWNVFATGHKVELKDDQNADALSYTATLSFNNAAHQH
ncbi:MAG: DUF4198 domain-containing protein [Cardiobacteriaceae bacterium]|nr:DUF4198 domain-containing protein [Cardiobacteriaceae bacterium]